MYDADRPSSAQDLRLRYIVIVVVGGKRAGECTLELEGAFGGGLLCMMKRLHRLLLVLIRIHRG